MTAVYGFCAVVGGALVLVMLLGGDADGGVDMSGDLDLDGDVNLDGTADGSGVGSVIASIFSFRTIIFVLAFFGVTGLILPLVGTGATATFIGALAVGGFAGLLNDRVLRYVTRTSGGMGITALSLSGVPASVTLPVRTGRRGRVTVEIDGRTVALVAEPYRSGEQNFETGATVVVIEVIEGVAKIAPFEIVG